jgi:hypothetical protein
MWHAATLVQTIQLQVPSDGPNLNLTEKPFVYEAKQATL